MGEKNTNVNLNLKKGHIGHVSQTFIYLGKLFRMFVFQSDWKVLPMSAVIAGLVSFTVGKNLFVSMEGTLTSSFAYACICVWNGFFNSIQSVCRERAIIKREHRSGLHISSYIVAHMIYQAVLCAVQSLIIIFVCYMMKVKLPETSLAVNDPMLEFGITIFLITYCSDMLALLVSTIARTTTAAMTIMPFLLIVQLLFSGSFFSLPQKVMPFTNLTVTKWGLTAICAQGDYNSLPMVSLWNSAYKLKHIKMQDGSEPFTIVFDYIEKNDLREQIIVKSAELNQNPQFAHDALVVYKCWAWLIVWTLIYVGAATIILEFIDKDRR
ncbi:MAG: ABC transporter permease [Lachnospiraceae bacterium]|nr:ABC transporter permease [Lachnospiraceae bacterium]